MIVIAYVKISIKEGISQKIVRESIALSNILESSVLYCLDQESNLQKISFLNGEIVDKEIWGPVKTDTKSCNRVNYFIEMLEKHIDLSEHKEIYIRHMIPSMKYIHFLKKCKKRSKIYIEIPTYPYFYEQFAASKNKLFTLLRLFYEIIFWPCIYMNVDQIVAIPCNSKAKKYKKMIFITNGYNRMPVRDNINTRNRSNNFIMVGVGSIQQYHGYEKLIEAIAEYNGKRNIFFYVVGNGLIEPLRELSKNLKVEDRVIFTGMKTGQELDKILYSADVGIGTMALELRHADIDTGIKILDYYMHGLPVVSSGMCPVSDELGFTPYLEMNGKIDLDSMIEWVENLSNDNREKIAINAEKEFSWENIFQKVVGTYER